MFRKLVQTGLVAIALVGSAATAQADHDGHGTKVVAHGTFEGRSDHEVSGGITILKTKSGYVAVLEPDFSLDNAPAPTLGFGKDGFDAETEFTKLASKTGTQVYAIPASIDPKSYTEFFVWCSQFSVPLGEAALTWQGHGEKGGE